MTDRKLFACEADRKTFGCISLVRRIIFGGDAVAWTVLMTLSYYQAQLLHSCHSIRRSMRPTTCIHADRVSLSTINGTPCDPHASKAKHVSSACIRSLASHTTPGIASPLRRVQSPVDMRSHPHQVGLAWRAPAKPYSQMDRSVVLQRTTNPHPTERSILSAFLCVALQQAAPHLELESPSRQASAAKLQRPGCPRHLSFSAPAAAPYVRYSMPTHGGDAS